MSDVISSYTFTEQGLDGSVVPEGADAVRVIIDYMSENQVEGELVFLEED